MTKEQLEILLVAREIKLAFYKSKIEELEAKVDELIDDLNEADDRFIELRRAYKLLKKSIEK